MTIRLIGGPKYKIEWMIFAIDDILHAQLMSFVSAYSGRGRAYRHYSVVNESGMVLFSSITTLENFKRISSYGQR